jgi:hypothetical protein
MSALSLLFKQLQNFKITKLYFILDTVTVIAENEVEGEGLK